MLIQMLSRLSKHYRVDFKVLFIWGTVPGVTISPKLYRQWAIKDANLIAEQYQLVPIIEDPTVALLTTGQQAWQLLVNNIENAEQTFINTWGNLYTEHYQTSTPTINHQVKNQTRLQAKGHYAPANIFFAGDWFVGVNRLFHFESMLLKLALLENENATFTTNIAHEKVAKSITSSLSNKAEPLVSYLSLGSPYSYLGFVQAINLAERHKLELVIKPVLPLLMRGASIPPVKQKYSYLDAVREAKRLGIEFNGFVDPTRDGVINVYRLFSWAQEQGKGIEYMLACFRAIYVNGIDLSKAKHVNTIFKQLALNVDDANRYQQQHDWQQWADINQIELTKLNLWGVPCFSYGRYSFWGQDRIPALAAAINELTGVS